MGLLNIFKKELNRYSLFRNVEPYEEKYNTIYDFLRLNEISLYLNKAIDKRAEKVGEIEFVLKRGDELIDHPTLDKLNNPNEFHTGTQFWSLAQKYYDLTGNVYIYIEKDREIFENAKIKGLYLLRPDLVNVEYNLDGTVKQYVYKRQDGKTIVYTPDQILYIFNPDPMNPLRGISLIRAGIRTIDTDIQLSEYYANVIANGGKIDGVFKINDPTMTRQRLIEMKSSYEEQYSEAKKSGRPLFLGGDMEYQNIGLNPTELSFLETKKVSLNDICILTGVPKEILASVGETTYANSDAAHNIFLRETIRPIMNRLTTILDWKLFDDTLELDFIDPTPDNVDKKLEAIKLAYDIHSISLNEKRRLISQVVDGFELEVRTETEADQIYQPLNLSPIDSGSSPEPEKEPKKELEKSVKADNQKKKNPLSDYNKRRQYEILRKGQMKSEEKKIYKVVKKLFHDQRDELINSLQGTKLFLGDVFNKNKEVERLKLGLPPILTEIMLVGANEALVFSGLDPRASATLVIQSWISKRTEEIATKITDTSFKELEGIFIESFSLGENRKQLIKRIEQAYTNWDTTRATMIARTETHSAFQKGTFEGYKEAGMEVKIWVATMINTRDSHIMNDGMELPMNIAFPNGQMFPGDTNVPVGEYINCQCSI